MLYLAKILVALVVFLAVSELAKRHPAWGGFISALPWITLLVVISRYQIDRATGAELVQYLMATFWFILPTLLLIGLMSAALHSGFGFYTSLLSSVVIAAAANALVAACLANAH